MIHTQDEARGYPVAPWWRFPVRDWSRDVWLVAPERAWWVNRWWCYVEGPFWRLLSALGVWDTGDGGYWRKGWWTWENRYARVVPEFPRDGREFWRRVWHGDLPEGLRYYPDSARAGADRRGDGARGSTPQGNAGSTPAVRDELRRRHVALGLAMHRGFRQFLKR